ncbi:hypothetical protein [Nocardia wallacei]|uniref:hypothetical protein n=1 Tax=Nocardia wallacei TaxID=480035 RepID=UPI0024561043|nr:hypothetical protein [Nocardia wallacei]
MTDAMIDVMSEDRRTIRLPDEEWETAQSLAESMQLGSRSEAIRTLIRDAAMKRSSTISGYQVEYRATLKAAVAGTDKPVVVEGLKGDEDELRALFPPRLWDMEARDVSPYRPAARR